MLILSLVGIGLLLYGFLKISEIVTDYTGVKNYCECVRQSRG